MSDSQNNQDIKDLMKEIQNFAIANAGLGAQLKTLTENVNNINKTLQDSSKGIVARMAVLENQISDLKYINTANAKGKWSLAIAMATGILALMGTILSNILS